MRIQKLAAALVVCVAFAGIAATAAQATLAWTVKEEGKVLSSETINSFSSPGDIPWEFAFSLLGTPVTIFDEGVTCAGECTVSGAGKTKLKLTFAKATVSGVSGCVIPGESFTTKALKGQVFMPTSGPPTSVFTKVEPEEGTVFFEVRIEGALCPIAGIYVFKGSLLGEGTVGTGFLVTDWMMRFKPNVQEFYEPEGGLKVGKAAVTTNGYTHDELIGANKGAKFGIME